MGTRPLWVLGYWGSATQPETQQRRALLVDGNGHAALHRVLVDLSSLPRLLSAGLVTPLDLGTEMVRYLTHLSGPRWVEWEALSTNGAYTEKHRPELLSEWDRPRQPVVEGASGDDLPF